MKVLAGPTFTIEVSGVGDNPAAGRSVQDNKLVVGVSSSSCLFLEKEGVGETPKCIGLGFGRFGNGKSQDDDDSDNSSSSIGAPDDDSEDGVDGEEVESKSNGGFSSLDSLEESLPIKRGLSNHFTGKSKSFGNLAELSTVKDLEKPENPFNKRRRVLIASKWSRKSSFYSWSNPKSMPLLAALDEDGDEQEQKDESSSEDKEPDEENDAGRGREIGKFHGRRLKSFKSGSCYSLADLQEHHQQP